MKRRILGGVAVVALGLVAVVAYVIATGLRPSHPVGFQWAGVADGDQPPLAVGLWYPTDASARPTLSACSASPPVASPRWPSSAVVPT